MTMAVVGVVICFEFRTETILLLARLMLFVVMKITIFFMYVPLQKDDLLHNILTNYNVFLLKQYNNTPIQA